MKLMRAAQWGVILSGNAPGLGRIAWLPEPGGLVVADVRAGAACSAAGFSQCRAPVAAGGARVWVARFHYRYPDDVRTIIRNCADMGVNTVLWQVRGAGTVAYPSRLEPWLEEFGFTSPGFDPLALAVEEAHRRGLRIEAWVNILPGWRGPKPPRCATSSGTPGRSGFYRTRVGSGSRWAIFT